MYKLLNVSDINVRHMSEWENSHITMKMYFHKHQGKLIIPLGINIKSWRWTILPNLQALTPASMDRLSILRHSVNQMVPIDAIWRKWSRPTLIHVKACCLTAPGYYHDQCWINIFGINTSTISPKVHKICWHNQQFEIMFMHLPRDNELWSWPIYHIPHQTWTWFRHMLCFVATLLWALRWLIYLSRLSRVTSLAVLYYMQMSNISF